MNKLNDDEFLELVFYFVLIFRIICISWNEHVECKWKKKSNQINCENVIR